MWRQLWLEDIGNGDRACLSSGREKWTVSLLVTEQDQTWELKVVHVYFRFVSFFVYVLGVCVCECVSF